MSIEAMAIALHHSRAAGTTKLVLVGVANHDGDGGAWPALPTLAKYSGRSVRQTQSCLRELEELGEIVTHYQAGGTPDTPEHERPNLYEFTLECPASCDRSKHHRLPGDRGYGVKHTSPARVKHTSPPLVMDASPAPVKPASPKPSREPSLEPGIDPPAPLSRSGQGCASHEEPVEGCRGCGLNPRALQRAAQRSAAAAARETERARLEAERQARAAVAATPSTVAAVTQTARQAIAASRGR